MRAEILSILKRSALAAFGFFGALCLATVGYSAYTGLSTVSGGQPLTVGLWTQIKDNFTDHETRIAGLQASQSAVGERIVGVAPATAITWPTGYSYVQKYVDLTPGTWIVSIMGEADLGAADAWNHNQWWLTSSSTDRTNVSTFTPLATSTWQSSGGTWVFISGHEIVTVPANTRLYVWSYFASAANTAASLRASEAPIAVRIK